MKQHKTSWLSACVVSLAVTACAGDRRSTKGDELMEETGGVGAAGSGGYGGASGYAGFGGTEEPDAAVEPSFEPFDISLNQTITVGAFRILIEKAAITPENYQYDERARIELAFSAENLSTELQAPFDTFWRSDDALLLDIEGQYFYGDVQADDVPGLRQGVGKLSWLVPTADVSPEQIAAATITLGDASQNAVVIPLAEPASSTTLNDIDLDLAFTVQGIRPSTLEITSGRVQYGSRGANEPYEAGTARLVILGGVGGPPDVYDYWQKEHLVLERPDGISSASDSSLIINREPEEAEFGFPIVQPVSGTYVVTIYGEDGKSATHEIVVP
jgi:hypothetical protein